MNILQQKDDEIRQLKEALAAKYLPTSGEVKQRMDNTMTKLNEGLVKYKEFFATKIPLKKKQVKSGIISLMPDNIITIKFNSDAETFYNDFE